MTVTQEIDRLLTLVSDSYQHMLGGSKAYKALRDVATSLEAMRAKLKTAVIVYPAEGMAVGVTPAPVGQLDADLDEASAAIEEMIMPTVAVFQEFTAVPPCPSPIKEAILGCLRAPEPLEASSELQIAVRELLATPPEKVTVRPGCQGVASISWPVPIRPEELTGHPGMFDGAQGERLLFGYQGPGSQGWPPTDLERVEQLMVAIKKHHADRGNDRCWECDRELYVAAGLEPGDPQLPLLDEHCRMCSRYRRGLYGKDAPDQWISIRLIGGSANYEATPGFGTEQASCIEVNDPHSKPAFILSMHGIKSKPKPSMVPTVFDCDWAFLPDESEQDRDAAIAWLRNHMEYIDFTPTMVAELNRFIDLLARGDKLLLYDDYWRVDRIVS